MTSVVEACAAIAGIVRPSYGPFGQDQLLVTPTQKLITNSASRILTYAKTGSPLTRLILGLVRDTGGILGDGTGTLAIMLEGALSAFFTELAEHHCQRVDLDRICAYLQDHILPNHVHPLLQRLHRRPSNTEDVVIGLARAFFGANFPADVCDQLSRLFWVWLSRNAQCRQCSVSEAASVLQQSGPVISLVDTSIVGSSASCPLSRSEVVAAHVITGVLAHPGMLSSTDGGRAIVIDGRSVTNWELTASDPAAVFASLACRLKALLKLLIRFNVRLVLCAAEIHDEWRGVLAESGITALHLIEQRDLDLLTQTVLPGTHVLPVDLGAINDATSFDQSSLIPIRHLRPRGTPGATQLTSARTVWIFESKSEALPPNWLILYTKSKALGQEYELALLRLLRVVAPALADPESTIAAGFAFEILLGREARARALDTSMARVHGLAWKLLLEAISRVLEAFVVNAVGHSLAPLSGCASLCGNKFDESLWPTWTGKPADFSGFAERGNANPLAKQRGILAARKVVRCFLVCDLHDGPARDALARLGIYQVGCASASHFGFVGSPGTGGVCAQAGSEEARLETVNLKTGLLNALGRICRVVLRLDSQPLIRCKRIVACKAVAEQSSASETESESSD